MLRYAIIFFVLAIIAAFFGFTGMAGTLESIARFLAVLFVVLFIATLVYSMVTGRSPPSVPPSVG